MSRPCWHSSQPIQLETPFRHSLRRRLLSPLGPLPPSAPGRRHGGLPDRSRAAHPRLLRRSPSCRFDRTSGSDPPLSPSDSGRGKRASFTSRPAFLRASRGSGVAMPKPRTRPGLGLDHEARFWQISRLDPNLSHRRQATAHLESTGRHQEAGPEPRCSLCPERVGRGRRRTTGPATYLPFKWNTALRMHWAGESRPSPTVKYMEKPVIPFLSAQDSRRWI